MDCVTRSFTPLLRWRRVLGGFRGHLHSFASRKVNNKKIICSILLWREVVFLGGLEWWQNVTPDKQSTT